MYPYHSGWMWMWTILWLPNCARRWRAVKVLSRHWSYRLHNIVLIKISTWMKHLHGAKCHYRSAGQRTYITPGNLATAYEKLSRIPEADSVMNEALLIATANQYTAYGRILIGQKRADKALEILKASQKRYGDVFGVNSGLVNGYSAKTDFKMHRNMQKKLWHRPDDASKKQLEAMILKLKEGKILTSKPGYRNILSHWIKHMKHAISWFEIPTSDINRAQKFYETIFGITMTAIDMENIKMRMFPLDNPMDGVGGALVDSGGFHKASPTEGPLIYLNGNPTASGYWIKWKLPAEKYWCRKWRSVLNTAIWQLYSIPKATASHFTIFQNQCSNFIHHH